MQISPLKKTLIRCAEYVLISAISLVASFAIGFCVLSSFNFPRFVNLSAMSLIFYGIFKLLLKVAQSSNTTEPSFDPNFSDYMKNINDLRNPFSTVTPGSAHYSEPVNHIEQFQRDRQQSNDFYDHNRGY